MKHIINYTVHVQQKLLFVVPGSTPPTEISEELVRFVEENTRAQRDSHLWLDLHVSRLTSSSFGAIRKAGPNCTSLINRVMGVDTLNR